MALKRPYDIWKVFTGECFRYITVRVCSIYADRSRIGCQDYSRESVRLSMEKDKIKTMVMYQPEAKGGFLHGRLITTLCLVW